jgi:hypothetical protein
MKKRGATLLVAVGVLVASEAAPQTPTPTPGAALAQATPSAAPAPTMVASPPVTPTPPLALPPTSTPTPRPRVEDAPPLRITERAASSIGVVPPENPFGAPVESPATLPQKPPLAELILQAPSFVELRVDPNGKVLAVRRVRDPIPSLQAETHKDLARWTFEPARKGAQKVETWAPLRLDLQVEVAPPRIETATLTPITPATALPAPVDWGNDEAWYQNVKVAPPDDGTVPITQVDVPPAPKRTPFPGSYKGPFSARFWVRVNPAGKVDRVIPIAASDPILIPYFKKGLAGWTLRPARRAGAAAESWNELVLSGQISYSVDIRQLAQLRKPLASS